MPKLELGSPRARGEGLWAASALHILLDSLLNSLKNCSGIRVL